MILILIKTHIHKKKNESKKEVLFKKYKWMNELYVFMIILYVANIYIHVHKEWIKYRN